MTDTSLRARVIAAYAGPAAPLAALGLPLSVYVGPLYVTELGLDQSMVGFILVAVRLLDIIVDPLIGWAGDSTRGRWGRRKPWMIAAVPLFMVGVFMLFIPPTGSGVGWFSTWLILSYLAYSIGAISHIAWGAELSGAYHERSRIQGWRECAAITGILLVLVLPILIDFTDPGAPLSEKVMVMGLFLMAAFPLTILVALFAVPEPDVPAGGAHSLDLSAAFRLIGSNKALRRLLAADLFQGLVPGMTTAMFLWMVTYYFGLGMYASALIFAFSLIGLAIVPIWMRISYRLSKHRTLAISMIWGICVMPFLLVIPTGNIVAASIVFMLFGAAYSASGFLLRSMMADVVDMDTLATGQERAGLYYSLLVMTNKLGYAAAGFVYPILAMVGFDGRRSDNPPEAVMALAIVYVTLPCICLALTALSVWNFPIDEAKQRDVRDAIASRRLQPRPAE